MISVSNHMIELCRFVSKMSYYKDALILIYKFLDHLFCCEFKLVREFILTIVITETQLLPYVTLLL